MKQAADVQFRNVFKRYGAVTAVDDVSFRIEPGTLCTLLGPSGCGKTTTLRLIAGLEMVSAGTITIGGRDVTICASVNAAVAKKPARKPSCHHGCSISAMPSAMPHIAARSRREIQALVIA